MSPTTVNTTVNPDSQTGPQGAPRELENRDWMRRQQALVAIGRRAIAPPELSILRQDAAALLAELFDAEHYAVAEPAPDGSLTLNLRLAREHGAPRTVVESLPADGRSSLAGYVLEAGHPLAVTELAQEKRFSDVSLRRHGIRSALAVPFRLQDRAYGAMIAASATPRNFARDDVLFAETIAHLVTTTIARTEAEKTLDQHLRLSEGILGVVGALVVILDPEGRITEVNRACEKLSGFALDELRGRTMWNVLAVPEELKLLEDICRAVQHGVSPVECESQLMTKHSARRWIAWTLAMQPDPTGEIQWIIATGTDITGQREAEERASEAERQMAMAAAKSSSSSETGGIERRRRPRRSYPYRQQIAFVVDSRLPEPEDFVDIQCHDIAAGGFSFYSVNPPRSDAVVVGLGVPPKLTYLTAQVAHIRRVVHEEEPMYLIGCMYTGRLS